MKYLKCSIVIPVILLLFLIYNPSDENEIFEEATPIRNKELIEGIKYDIKIGNCNKNKIIYTTKAIESINHYTDISTLNSIYINFNLYNDSKNKYYLKKIIVTSKDKIIKIYNYKNIIKNSNVRIRLSNRIFEKVYVDHNIVGNIKIVIEK